MRLESMSGPKPPRKARDGLGGAPSRKPKIKRQAGRASTGQTTGAEERKSNCVIKRTYVPHFPLLLAHSSPPPHSHCLLCGARLTASCCVPVCIQRKRDMCRCHATAIAVSSTLGVTRARQRRTKSARGRGGLKSRRTRVFWGRVWIMKMVAPVVLAVHEQ